MIFTIQNSTRMLHGLAILTIGLVATTLQPTIASAQNDQNEKNKRIALAKRPALEGIDFDSPTQAEEADCTLESSAKIFGGRGFVIKNPAGQIVRLYVKESNGAVHWTFFKNGNEVYREIDSDGDRRIDQYRWLGDAGTRWGIDSNQDGQIDSWKVISAEEVAYEVFQAYQTGDRTRLLRLCLNNEDLAQIKLGRELQTKVVNAVTETLQQAKNSIEANRINRSAEFVDFSGIRPSIVPAGKLGLQQDLTIYDNTSVLFAEGDQIGNLSLGTLIKVGEAWRVVELPQFVKAEVGVTNGRMFALNADAPVQVASENSEVTELIAQYTKIDEQLRSERASSSKAKLYQQRTDIILKIAETVESAQDRSLWVRMCATEASVGYQMDEYPQGLKVLGDLAESDLASEDRDFVDWEFVQAKARDTRKGDEAEMEAANDAYLKTLEEFVDEHPKSEYSAQALIQLAMFEEFSSSSKGEDNAIRWYEQAAENFPDSREGRFASGAKRRMTSYGERLSVSGRTLDGRSVDTSDFRRKKIVVIHYWSTQDELSLEDFDRLASLAAKYEELAIVGVNLDDDAAEAKSFLRKQPKADWPQLWAEGGKQNSPLALEMGVTSVPLTLLIDMEGTVVENRAIAGELDRQIQRLRNRRK